MRINIFGGPGVGKSTISSFIFSCLKEKGEEIELINEYIKSWAWQKKVPQSWDQFYTFSKQLYSEDIVSRQNVNTITDSPLWLQVAYIMRNKYLYLDECISVCKKFDETYPDNLNIFIERTVNYKQEGRYENLSQAIDMDNLIKKVLKENDIKYYCFEVQEKEKILKTIFDNVDF